jgi:hypothetical protein
MSAERAAHALTNSGLCDLIFLVVTSPVTDEPPV